MVYNLLYPMNLKHLEAQFKENGVSGMVFVHLTDVRARQAEQARGEKKLTCISLFVRAGGPEGDDP